MTFLDTGIMVGALLESHPEHEACLVALEDSVRPFTNAHALAETFATLSGFYKVPTDAATELTLSLRDSVAVEALVLADYETAIREARSRGVMGGGIYDSLHATFARRKHSRS
jgi:predicted nucleic acid-binding protein